MLKNNNRKLFSNFIVLSAIQGANLLLSFLVIPYVILKVGADGFGAIAVAQMVMTYLSTISDYGFTLTATRDIALYKEDHIRLSRIFFIVLTSKMMITISLFVLLILLGIFTPVFGDRLLLYLFGFTFVFGQSLFVNWFLQGIEKMYMITITTLIGRLIFVALVFLFINEKADSIYYLFFFGIGNIVAGILSIWFAIRISQLKFILPTWKDISGELKEGWQITISSLTVNSYFYSNVFILRIFTSDLIVGYYSIAERILFAARQILTLFAQVAYPYVVRITQKSKKETNAFFREIYFPFLLLIFTGCCILFIFSAQIIHIFIGNESLLPVVLLRLLSFVPVIVCLNIPANHILLAFKHDRSYVRIITLGTIVNLVVNISLVNVWGATGTALSIIITELFITIGLNLELYKHGLASFIANNQTQKSNCVSMRINKYFPFAFIYFFINSLGLPFGLTYTAVFAPLFYWWVVTTRKREILLPFFVCMAPFIIIHLMLGVDVRSYTISVINFTAVYIFCPAFYTFLKECRDPELIFRRLLVFNFILCMIAIPVYFTSYDEILWMKNQLTEGISDFTRLKLFTYEASYYATLFTPLFFFYFLQVILKQNKINSWLLLLLLLTPYVLSFSIGVITSILVAVMITYLLYFKILTQKRRVLNLFILTAIVLLSGFAVLYFFFPGNSFFLRLENIFSGHDTSGKGRTSDAFILAEKIIQQRSAAWGIGPGQIKILGSDIVRTYYMYTPDYGTIAIPNATAETLAIFGWVGLCARIALELFLFFLRSSSI